MAKKAPHTAKEKLLHRAKEDLLNREMPTAASYDFVSRNQAIRIHSRRPAFDKIVERIKKKDPNTHTKTEKSILSFHKTLDKYYGPEGYFSKEENQIDDLADALAGKGFASRRRKRSHINLKLSISMDSKVKRIC